MGAKRFGLMRDLFDEFETSPRLGSLGYAAPNTHANDPPSSAIAAASIEASGARERHAEIVLGLVRSMPGRTAIELFESAAKDVRAELKEPQECRRRLVDLETVGLVRKGEARKCAYRQTTMVVWFVTEG